MLKNFNISIPFFEFGPKAYMYGKELLDLVKQFDKLAQKYDIDVIIDPQTADIRLLSSNTSDRVRIFAQHMDSIPIGRGMGTALAEALKEAGAEGVMLNHAEKPLPLAEIKESIKRADEAGLATMVCGNTVQEIKEIAYLAPNIIVAEPSELVGTGRAVDKEYVDNCIHIIKSINPDILVLPSAGISTGQDCYNIISLGAEATGCSSGIAKAKDRALLAEEMISSVRRAYDDLQNKKYFT
jgi:triosephosphate isomerase